MDSAQSGTPVVDLELKRLAQTLSRTEQSVTRRVARLLEGDGARSSSGALLSAVRWNRTLNVRACQAHPRSAG